MPGSALRVALALGVLALAGCRTKDNPDVCRGDVAGDCSPGYRCEPLIQKCVPALDGGGPDGSRDGPGGETRPGDGPVSSDGPPAGCKGPPDCTGERPVCSPTGRCVGCLAHADCKSDPLRPVCGSDSTCVGCGLGGATACMDKSAATPLCGRDGDCVECKTSPDCKQAATPACIAGKCMPCTADSQCAEHGANPGVCLTHMGGTCARQEDVIYVQRIPGCVDGPAGPGTAEMPFCSSQDALEDIEAGSPRRILVLRGGALPLPAINVRAEFAGVSGGIISIIGQQDAEIAAGANPGIAVRAGEVYVRGLTIRNSEVEGVLADGPVTIRLHRSVIRNNKKGGVRVQGGAGFEVVNTVIDQNEPGLVNATPFGGVFLGAPEAGRPDVFRFNTVIRNLEVGVACGKPTPALQELNSVLLWRNMGAEQRNCEPKHSLMGVEDPGFDTGRPYHLTKDSPCVDKGDPQSFPPEDRDGQRRPAGVRSDCGADEFQPD